MSHGLSRSSILCSSILDTNIISEDTGELDARTAITSTENFRETLFPG